MQYFSLDFVLLEITIANQLRCNAHYAIEYLRIILFVIPRKSTFSHASRSRSRKFGIRYSQINLKCLRFIVLQVPREFPIAQLIFSMLHIYIVLPMYVYMGFIIRYEQIWFVHSTNKNHSLPNYTWHSSFFPPKKLL